MSVILDPQPCVNDVDIKFKSLLRFIIVILFESYYKNKVSFVGIVFDSILNQVEEGKLEVLPVSFVLFKVKRIPSNNLDVELLAFDVG